MSIASKIRSESLVRVVCWRVPLGMRATSPRLTSSALSLPTFIRPVMEIIRQRSARSVNSFYSVVLLGLTRARAIGTVGSSGSLGSSKIVGSVTSLDIWVHLIIPHRLFSRVLQLVQHRFHQWSLRDRRFAD